MHAEPAANFPPEQLQPDRLYVCMALQRGQGPSMNVLHSLALVQRGGELAI